MENLKKTLKSRLHNSKKIAVLGVGSELRGDDVAGLLVAEGLSGLTGVEVFIGSTAPESMTGEIKRFKPTHLVIIDAADMGLVPGAVRSIAVEDIGGISFCTHSLPMNILADYLIDATGCEVIFIGIQPKSVVFGSPLSDEVKKGVASLTDAIRGIMCSRGTV